MECAQTAGIDLPLKALAWQDAAGQVWLSFNDPQYLARRHEIKECGEVVSGLRKALDGLVRQAVK
ncbi:camphor resistance protein CrcB [compost metagenome]